MDRYLGATLVPRQPHVLSWIRMLLQKKNLKKHGVVMEIALVDAVIACEDLVTSVTCSSIINRFTA